VEFIITGPFRAADQRTCIYFAAKKPSRAKSPVCDYTAMEKNKYVPLSEIRFLAGSIAY
jgi:hypothetical protein